MMKLVFFLAVVFTTTMAKPANPVRRSEYVDCRPGTLNVILGAPHGGTERPDSIRDREAGCYIDGSCVWSHDCGATDSSNCGATTVRDTNTLELTLKIAEELKERTGQWPTMSIVLLHRTKLDANREINEATFGEEEAIEAWEAYNACINASKVDIEENYEQGGLFFDIHGHGHPNVWAELGYLITGSNLDNDNFQPEDTSISYLSEITGDDFETLLRGESSFGAYLEDEDYMSVPSPTHKGPGGESYFSGGYNTRIHGSRDGGKIDAIQIESPRAWRDPPYDYGTGIAKAIIKYLDSHKPEN